MKAKQAVKHFTLLSMMAAGTSACSSTQDIDEQTVQAPVAIEQVVEKEPIEAPKEVVSAVINNGVIDIPILEDAQVFAEFSDSLPAVINYFTNHNEAQVIDFYQQAFGVAKSQERKRDRLTLKYQQGEESMRVVISQQNDKRQVDIIVESKI